MGSAALARETEDWAKRFLRLLILAISFKRDAATNLGRRIRHGSRSMRSIRIEAFTKSPQHSLRRGFSTAVRVDAPQGVEKAGEKCVVDTTNHLRCLAGQRVKRAVAQAQQSEGDLVGFKAISGEDRGGQGQCPFGTQAPLAGSARLFMHVLDW